MNATSSSALELAGIEKSVQLIDTSPSPEDLAEDLVWEVLKTLPGGEFQLIQQHFLEALAVLREHRIMTYNSVLQLIRHSSGRLFLDAIHAAIGGVAPHSRRDIALLTPAQLLARPAPLDVIAGVLPQKGTAAIIGESGSGKTYFSLHVLYSILTGERFFDRRVRQGSCIYVSAEGSPRTRLQALAQHRGVSLDGLPLRIIEQPVQLRGVPSDTKRLIAAVRAAASEIGSPAVVLVDTLNRTFGGGNENASEDMGEYLGSMGELGVELDCLCLAVHHTGKDAGRGARGHSSFRAGLDTEIEVTRDATGLRTATITKQRDGNDGERFSFRLQSIDLGPHPDPEAGEDERLNSCVVVPSNESPAEKRAHRLPPSAQVALDALRSAIEMSGEILPSTSVIPRGVKAVRLKVWQDCYAKHRTIPSDGDPVDVKKERNSRRMAMQRAQDQLQAAKVVGTWDGWWWVN